MGDAPDRFKPPWARSRDSGHKFRQRDDPDDLKGFYQRMPWRNFRARQKKKQRAQDEKRIHEMYHEGGYRFREYMEWLRSDAPLCVDCLQDKKIVSANTLDHITRIKDGGAKFDPANVQWLCQYHHNVKSGKEAHE